MNKRRKKRKNPTPGATVVINHFRRNPPNHKSTKQLSNYPGAWDLFYTPGYPILKDRRTYLKKLLVLSLLVVLTGCAAIQPHKGSVSAFDSNTADTLDTLQNTLEGLSAHIQDYPAAKPALNQAREYYTVAKNLYLQWRCDVGASRTLGPSGLGAPCPANVNTTQAQVQGAVDKTQGAVATVQSQTTGGKP